MTETILELTSRDTPHMTRVHYNNEGKVVGFEVQPQAKPLAEIDATLTSALDAVSDKMPWQEISFHREQSTDESAMYVVRPLINATAFRSIAKQSGLCSATDADCIMNHSFGIVNANPAKRGVD